MPAGIPPFFRFNVIRDNIHSRNILSWILVPGPDILDIQIFRDAGLGFSLLTTILVAVQDRYLDLAGSATDEYFLRARDSLTSVYPDTLSVSPITNAEPLCAISGTVIGFDGLPKFAVNVIVEPSIPIGVSALGFGVSKKFLITTTDASGFFSIDVLQNAIVRFKIPDADIDFQTQIPDESAIDFSELLLVGGPIFGVV